MALPSSAAVAVAGVSTTSAAATSPNFLVPPAARRFFDAHTVQPDGEAGLAGHWSLRPGGRMRHAWQGAGKGGAPELVAAPIGMRPMLGAGCGRLIVAERSLAIAIRLSTGKPAAQSITRAAG